MSSSNRRQVMLNLPAFTQKKPNDCSPACIFIVLKYFGIKTSYKSILDMSKCGETDGVPGATAAKVLTKFGLDAEYQDFCTVNGLRELCNAGIPVIVHWFAPRIQNPGVHASVVQSVAKKSIRLMDPAIGRSRLLSIDDFENLWFSIDPFVSRRTLAQHPLSSLGIHEAVIPHAAKFPAVMHKKSPIIKKIG